MPKEARARPTPTAETKRRIDLIHEHLQAVKALIDRGKRALRAAHGHDDAFEVSGGPPSRLEDERAARGS